MFFGLWSLTNLVGGMGVESLTTGAVQTGRDWVETGWRLSGEVEPGK